MAIASAVEFDGAPCQTVGCSDYRAGYDWATKNNTINPANCEAKHSLLLKTAGFMFLTIQIASYMVTNKRNKGIQVSINTASNKAIYLPIKALLLVTVVFFLLPTTTQAKIARYKGFLIFLASGEEMYFNVEHNLQTGTAQLSGRTTQGGVCQGMAWAKSPPNNALCIGQKAALQLTCTNGHNITVDLLLDNCMQGFGLDINSNDPSIVTFGSSESALKQRALEISKTIQQEAAPAWGLGTGFFITNDGGLVTNYHVIENMKSIRVYDPKYNIWADVQVMRVDKVNDVALLLANRRSKALPMASRFNMRKGERIFVLGYPSLDIQGSQQKATFGHVNSVMGAADDVRYFQIDSPIQPGNSGGPVFNEAGEVVGIVTSRLNGDYQNVNYALKIDYFFPLLASLFSDIYKYDDPNAKPKPGSLPELVERYEDSVVIIVVEK